MTVPSTPVPPRSEIKPEHTWNAPSVFSSDEAWEAELRGALAKLSELDKYRGHLSDGAATLAGARALIDELVLRAGKVYVYANMAHRVDTTNQAASKMYSRALGLFGQVAAAAAVFDPELLAIGQAKLQEMLRVEPRLPGSGDHEDARFR